MSENTKVTTPEVDVEDPVITCVEDVPASALEELSNGKGED